MEIRAAEILEPEFDGEMYFVRWVPRGMRPAERSAFSAAYRAGLDRSSDRFAGILEGGMPRHGQAGWLAWEIKSDVREDDHRREYAAAAAVRHLGLTRQQVAEHQAAADRIEDAIRYEAQRAAEPDCRDEDDEPAVARSLADLADGPVGDPEWQAKVWERIGRGTCAIDGCNEPIAEDALCAGHQPGAVQAAMDDMCAEDPETVAAAQRVIDNPQPFDLQAASAFLCDGMPGMLDHEEARRVTPHPDTIAAPLRSWPPNTGCDPEDVS